MGNAMHFDPSSVPICDLSDLTVHDHFLTRRDDRYVHGILFQTGQKTFWLEISSTGAHCYELSVGVKKQVIRLPLPESKLRLWIDTDRRVKGPSPGRLVFTADHGVCLVVTWPEAGQGENSGDAFSIKDWRMVGSISERNFVFDAWALGYEKDGQWVDVVRREPAA
jgi:hypothetical protein